MPLAGVTAAVADSAPAGNPAGNWRLPAALGAALAVPLLGYAFVGSFARYAADDYCWAGVLRTEGFLRAQMLWYTGYSPRYAFTFLVNLVELAGPAIVPALPAAALVAWLATLTWTFVQFKVRLGRLKTTTSAFLLAEATALGCLQSAPDLAQSLYWQTAMLTYLLPLVLATFLIGWLRRALDQPRLGARAVGVSGLVTFVAGGLSETYLIPQNVALTLALLVCVLVAPRGAPRRVAAAHLAVALGGGVLALLTIVVAPSTASRVGGSPADLWLASSAAIATAAYQVLRLVRFFGPAVLLCLGLPALLATGPGRVNPRWFALVTAGVAITLPFCYFPSFYAQNGNPPARSLIVPGTMLIGYLIFAGYSLAGLPSSRVASSHLTPLAPLSSRGEGGRISAAEQRTLALARRKVPEFGRFAVVIMLALVQVGQAVAGISEQAIAAQHAAALWDTTDQHIRASRDAGQTDVTVLPVPAYLGENFVGPDRTDYFNVCVARFYGVRSIAAEAP